MKARPAEPCDGLGETKNGYDKNGYDKNPVPPPGPAHAPQRHDHTTQS